MKDKLMIFVLFFIFISQFSILVSQEAEDTLKTYQKEFLYGNFEEKYHIIKKALSDYPQALNDLSVQGLKFIIDNWDIVKDEKSLNAFSILVLRNMNNDSAKENSSYILKLFNLNSDDDVKIDILKLIAKVPVRNDDIITQLDSYLEKLNASYKEGADVNKAVIIELVRTLGKLESASSYRVLFSVLMLKYSDEINKQVNISLSLLEGDLKDKVMDTITNSSFDDKLAALIMTESNPVLSDTAKAEIAAHALSVVVADDIGITDENSEAVNNIRFRSSEIVNKFQWAKASASVIRYFNISLQDYDKEKIKAEDLVKVINTVGSVGTSEAAFRLNQYLIYINATTTEKSPVEDSIIVAVIRNLGKLGDKMAFDALLNIRFLKYSENVKKEAELALRKIKFQ